MRSLPFHLRSLLLFLLLFVGGQTVFAQAANREPPLHQVDGSFVREWLVLGPFPGRNLDIDFLADAGGEANVRPKEGDRVRTKDGKEFVWTRLRSNHDVVDFEQVFSNLEWSVLYAYCELNSNGSTETRGATWPGGTLRINGTNVTWSVGGDRFDMPPVFPMPMSPGRNPCLVKIRFEFQPPFAFSFQPLPSERATAEFHVTNPGGQPIPRALIEIYDRGEKVTELHTDASGMAQACFYPLADSYEARLTSNELGAWLPAFSLRPGERRRFDVGLAEVAAVSGKVLAMDGSPQSSIVVQAVCVSADADAIGATRLNRPNQTGFYASPSLNMADDGKRALHGKETAKVRSLFPMPPFSMTVLSDTNGNFRFENLRRGQYRLRAHGAGGHVFPEGEGGSNAAEPITVEPGRTHHGVRFVMGEVKKGVSTVYSVKQGLKELVPMVAHRTPDGMLWVGTYERTIHSYDGVAFSTYSVPEISGNYVRVIAHDLAGTVWIGTDKGIGQFAGGRVQTVPFSETLPGKDVSSIEVDSDGTLWFSTTSGLCKYDGRRLSRWSIKEGAPSNGIGALLRTREGELWMSTSRSLARFDGRQFSEPILLSGPRPAIREKLHQARDGAIWFCSPEYEKAAFRFDGTNLFRLGKEDGLVGDQVFDIAETSDGILWFATNAGISRFDGTTLVNYTFADGLGLGEVRSIFVDSDDVLWCATYAGISRLDPKSFGRITKRDGLINQQMDTPSVFAIEPDAQGGYLIGTEWGGLYRLEGEARDRLTKADFLDRAYVRHIQRSTEGTLWFGTADGIYRLAQGGIERVLERNWIIAMKSDDQGQLWFGQGWIGGGLTRYNPQTKEETTFTQDQGLPDDSVWTLERAAGNGLWIGTGSGLAVVRDGKIENVGKNVGIPPSALRSLHRDNEEALWVGGATGLLRLQGTNVLLLNRINGTLIEDIWCSVRGKDGILWIGTDKNGLFGYDGQAITQLDKRDGLTANSVFSLRPDTDGSLLVGLINGGLSFYRRTKTPPSVRIIEAKLEDRTFSEVANLPSTQIGQRVSVQYQEIDLKTHPEKRQFKYRVLGPSGKTLFAGLTKERRFEWTPHKGGAYSFEVEAIDRDLNYSKPARLTFRATVPWYANPWIIVPGGSAFGGLVIWAFVSRAIYVRQRRESERLREQMLRQEREAREALEEKTGQLEKAKQAADAANHAKSTFLANMSHEIRTPLNAIMGYAQILRRKPTLHADDRAAVKTIESSGDHLLTLINSVLDLSKIEAGSMEVRPADFDLAQLLKEVAAMFRIRCEEKALTWRVEFHRPSAPSPAKSSFDLTLDPVPVRGDEVKLRQVLINLLGNAVKFTDTGQVTLRVMAGAQPSCEAPTSGSGPSAIPFTFEIVDSGPGIDAEAKEKLFAPFVQVGDGMRKGGTGLGLAISRRLVELMGGTIGLRSALGAGCTFYFTVPLGPASAKLLEHTTAEIREPSHLADGFAVEAVIVDDIEPNRAVLMQILGSLGCRARAAESGERALELIRQRIPDIVFTDARMPGMSGFELRLKIVEEFGADRMKVVAISASVLAHEQKQYLESGFDDFIGKPFRVGRIAECLARLLSVKFEYASDEQQAASQINETPEQARVRLPGPLWTRLRSAAKAYRIVEFKRCLAEVQELGGEERRLAAALDALNQKGDMDRILEILDHVTKE
ncbi:MAG: two-component regulator propeller domain-containing protein [Verrucomicrobiota bacterium]